MGDARKAVLETHFSSHKGALRPIATSLNGDNSWLLSFPRPEDERKATGRVFYHIAFDPWLAGPTGLFSPWFIHITLPAMPAIPDVAAVNEVAGNIEHLAAKNLPGFQAKAGEGEQRNIDAILVAFHYDDHLHKATLLQFDKRTPVFTTPQGAAIINLWRHFDTVRMLQDMPSDATTWLSPALHPGYPFPSWLTCMRFPGSHELNFAWALVWTHADSNGKEIHESIIGTPHGMSPSEEPYAVFSRTKPPTKKLALVHGLKESFAIGSQNTFGVKGGLAMNRKLGGVGNWLVSHNALLGYGGILLRLLYVHDVKRTWAWALEENAKQSKEAGSVDLPNFLEVENGSSVILE